MESLSKAILVMALIWGVYQYPVDPLFYTLYLFFNICSLNVLIFKPHRYVEWGYINWIGTWVKYNKFKREQTLLIKQVRNYEEIFNHRPIKGSTLNNMTLSFLIDLVAEMNRRIKLKEMNHE